MIPDIPGRKPSESHEVKGGTTEKIEIVGKTTGHIIMRYHQASNPANIGEFMVFRANPPAWWFDDYYHALTDFEPKKLGLF